MGTATRIPVSRAWRSAATSRVRRSSSPRNAARCRYCPQLPQERGPPKDTRRPDALRPERPHQLRRPRPRHPEQPLHVAPREQVPVQGLELPDGVGDGEEPPGRGGHRGAPCRLQPLRRVRLGKMYGAHAVL